MISLVLIFGFLCRSSIFRYPDNLRNVRVSPVTAANTGSGYGAPAGTGKVDERISNQGDLSTGPSAAYPSLSGLYVCICLCVFVFVSQQGHRQSTHPHRWKTPICQSPPSPLTRREAAHTESRNITLNMNSLSLSSKRFGKNNLYDWICFWQYVDDNLQIPAEYRALKQGSASTQDALNEVT